MNIVITGANRGIGLALVKHYRLNHNVFALCRAASSELKSLTDVTIIENVDVCNVNTINKAVKSCPNDIDLLINNAGILQRVSFDQWDEKRVMDQFNINAIGPIRVTRAFNEKLVKNSKIALITSRMGSIADNDSGSHYGYRMSKAALNMAGKSMAIDFRDRDISIAIIHPGWVQTDMTGHTGHVTVETAAQQISERIRDLDVSTSGTFWHANGDLLPW
ncbi:MAG: SDR family oxidoreductase [Candidatus Margulisiibacteriota bacterium]|jgi:NAD(P)-dependent dehydrogenase (short-subunit alcohol dehydrogenase family)